MPKNIIFALLFSAAFVTSLHPKVECVLKKLYAELDFPEDIRMNLQRELNQRDFAARVELTPVNIYEALGAVDHKAQNKIWTLLSSFPQLPGILQRNIRLCQFSITKLQAYCRKVFKGNCDSIDEFVVGKSCPQGYESVGYSHCVPACPTGYDDVNDDPFVCSKAHASARAGELQDRFHVTKESYRGLVDAYRCPENFTLLLNDICVRDCPFGWEDLGTVCLKPSVVRRDYEIFSYSFAMDDVPLAAE